MLTVLSESFGPKSKMGADSNDGIHLSARPTRRQIEQSEVASVHTKLSSRSAPTQMTMKSSSAHNAVARADLDTLNKLLEDTETLHCLNTVSIHYALKMSLGSGAILVRESRPLPCWQAGWSLLHTAAQYDHENVGEILYGKGLSVNVCGMVGESPLHVCAMFGSKRMADLLLDYKADPGQV